MKNQEIKIVFIGIGLFLFHCFSLQGQDNNIEVKNNSRVFLYANLSFEKDNKPSVKEDMPNFRQENIISNPSLIVKSGDLHLDFDINAEGEGQFNIELIVFNQQGEVIQLRPELLHGDIGTEIKALPGQINHQEIVFANNVDGFNPNFLSGPIKIELSVEYYDFKYNCKDTIPDLKWLNFDYAKGYSYEIALGLGGIITWGVGQFKIKKESDDIYNNLYREEITDKGLAEMHYQDANEKHKTAVRTKALGIGLFSISAISFLSKKMLQNTRRKVYDCNCNEGREYGAKACEKITYIELFNDSGFSGAGEAYVGLGLRFTF